MYVVAYCSLYEGTLEQEIVYASCKTEAVLRSTNFFTEETLQCLSDLEALEQMQELCFDWDSYLNVLEV